MGIIKCTIKKDTNKEKLETLVVIIMSIILMILMKSTNKYSIFVHGMYATFLIAMGIIVFNTMKFNRNRFSIFLGNTFALTGILEIMYLFVYLNINVHTGYINNFIIVLSIMIDLLPIVGIYMSFNNIEENKYNFKIIFILLFILLFKLVGFSYELLKQDELLLCIDVVITITVIFTIIIINNNIKLIGDKLDKYERDVLKKIIIIIILSRIFALFYIFTKDLYIKDILKQIINNMEIYYLYKYIIYINVKRPYTKLNEINNELIQKSKSLKYKNKKLIEETEKIEELKKTLIKKELKLKSTLDTSINSIIVFNKDKEINYVNKSFIKKFGDSKLFKDNYKIERDLKPIIKNYDDLIKSIDDIFEFNKNIEGIVYTYDNEIYQSIFSPLIIKNKIQGVLCILIDKTKKKEFEEKIIDANKRYEKFLESVGDGIIVIQNDEKIYVNKACKEILKDKLNEINFKIDIKNDNLEECYEIDGKRVYVEMSFSEYTKNNENKTIIVIRDITERKKAQLKLKESQKSYTRFIDVLPYGICLLNKDLQITYANQSLLNMLQIESIDKIEDLNIKNIINLDSDEEILFNRKINKVINKNKYMLLLEYELVKYNKDKIQVEINALPFVIDENKYIMLIIKDITHKKISEMVEKELIDRLKTDKIKTEFFANMSHELKTPLNVISSSNQLLDYLYKSSKIEDYNDNMKSHIELVRQSSYRLQRLISNVIDLTKMEAGFYTLKLYKYNIVTIIEDLFMKVDEYASKKDISIIFDTDSEEINIDIDKTEIERIILNLLSNCIKFTNNGGQIYVNIYDKKDSVVVCVKDNGVGIPINKIDIIFEEFTQVDKTLSRNTEGSGIGLAIVKNLVELHQGSIKVNSEEGIGTEFVITIPITNIVQGDYKEDRRIYNTDEKIKIEFSDIYY